MTTITPETTYYDILNIRSAENSKHLSGQELKQAYHRALLLHHPDKLKPAGKVTHIPQPSSKGDVYSVDGITAAYKTLSDPKRRAEYDKELQILPQRSQSALRERTFHMGLETVDLDDMEYNEALGLWFGSCRCGDTKGFQITETDLEKESEEGEILTGCKGCSLWLRILFATSE